MKRIFLCLGCLLFVLVLHDSVLVSGMTDFFSSPGKLITAEVKKGRLLTVPQGVVINVPFVSVIPTNEVISKSISTGVVIADDSNVYVKLAIGGYTRRFFSVFPNFRWICLTELVGVIDPESLKLDEDVRKKHTHTISYLVQHASSVNTLRHDGSWGYGGLRRLEIVRNLIQEELEGRRLKPSQSVNPDHSSD